MDIKDIKIRLLKDGEPVLYDLKDEFKQVLGIVSGDTNIRKWEKYKAYKPNRKDDIDYGIDCDVCELAVSVYNYIWSFLQNIKRPSKLFDKRPNYTVYQYIYQLKKPFDSPDWYYHGDTMTSFTHTYKRSEKYNDEEINKEISKLAKLHHTIGNMIPVPSGFNCNRAGTNARCDFWDLTMQQIKQYYVLIDNTKKRKEPLEKLLNPTGENENLGWSITNCEEWLSNFEGWNDFVSKNYLEDYIVKGENGELKKDENSMFEPLLFWENHSYTNLQLPETEKDFLEYLIRLNRIIEKRNKTIIEQLILY